MMPAKLERVGLLPYLGVLPHPTLPFLLVGSHVC